MRALWMRVLPAVVLGLAMAVLAVPSTSTAMSGGANCSDFNTQAAAQQWFLNHGGPQSDPAGLDADNDGIACESNPCPCSYDQGGGGGGGTPGTGGGGGPSTGVVHGAGRGEWCYTDNPADAAKAINVKKTCLDVQKRGYLRVRVFGGDFVKDRTDLVRIYFDTLRKRKQPEFSVSWYLGKSPASDVRSMHFAKTESWRNGVNVKCKNIGRFVDYRRDIVTAAVPRKCLGNPAAVRWAGFVGQISRVTKHSMFGKWDDFPRENAFPAMWVA